MLSAFPAELDAVLVRARHRAPRPIVADGHAFYLGRLGRHDAVMAMTGIGPVNARQTTEAALGRFTCGSVSAISAVVFSGVAGSTHRIGDVAVPRRWSDDNGGSWLAVDAAMFAAAQRLAAEAPPVLLHDNPAPDPLCLCIHPGAVTTVPFPYAPQVFVGGDGYTTDPFGGRDFPCIPSGGDVFGCNPCHGRPGAPPDVVGFLTGALPFADGQFVVDYLSAPEGATANAAAVDNETTAVGRVATAHHIPFIGFRGVSDGAGDPLMLPGFPAQFFTYYPISAANAATTAAAFLQRW